MYNIPEIIKKIRSGVVSISFFRNDERIGSGTGFISNSLLISNSHVFYDSNNNPLSGSTVEIKLDNGISFEKPYEKFMEQLKSGSAPTGFDFAVFDVQEIKDYHLYNFKLGCHDDVIEGEQILVMGYPFGSNVLTSHVGHVSAKYCEGLVNIIKLDASVNSGNSGGPLVDLKTLKVIGIVTRKLTGLTENFDELIKILKKNFDILDQRKGGALLNGVDTVEVLAKTQHSMAIISENIKRSANVGIGYAFSCEKLLQENIFLKDEKSSENIKVNI